MPSEAPDERSLKDARSIQLSTLEAVPECELKRARAIQLIDRLECPESRMGDKEAGLVEHCAVAAITCRTSGERSGNRVVLGLDDSPTGLHGKVWMVEQVEHLGFNPDCLMLGDVKRTGQPEINFVDPGPVEGIVSDSRHRAGASNSNSGVARRLVDRTIVEGVV